MRYHPVTVEQVLAHELTHLTLKTQDEDQCVDFENNVARAKGGTEAYVVSIMMKNPPLPLYGVRSSGQSYASLPVAPAPK